MMETILLSPLFYPIILPVVLLLVVFLLLLPRKRGPSSPPMISSNPNIISSSIPIVGPCLEFVASPMKMVKRCYDDYGPVFTVPILHQRLTFLVGPEAQEPFFKLGDDSLSPQECYGFMKAVFGPGVVYDASKKNRQVQFQSMAHGLRSSRLKGYIPKIERETRLYLKGWGEEGEINLFDALSELTILTASRCLHGNDVREKMFKEVSQLYHDLDHGVTPLTVFWPNAPMKVHRDRDRARKEMVSLFSKIIDTRRNDPSDSLSDGTDILSIFMDITYKDGTPITDEEITGLLIALLFAGQHTSCITSTWTSLFIANDKRILKKVVEEQNRIFDNSEDQEVDWDKVNDMPYLHDCMREALRLCPPLILLMRKALKDITVKTAKETIIVPKGDTVLVSPSVGMRLSSVFPKPDEFEPERYEEGREEHKIPFAYLGFGGGMHTCMGQNFAFTQVKTILSVLFRDYEIELLDDFPEQDFEAMVVGPKGECRIKYKRRKGN